MAPILRLFGALALTATAVSSSKVLTVVEPCPKCPSTATVPAITVTAQHQQVKACTPATVPGKAAQTPDCYSTYGYVSTLVAGQAITAIEQVVTLKHISTVLTETIPCPTIAARGIAANATTGAPHNFHNGTAPSTTTACSPKTSVVTLIEDDTAPYYWIADWAIPGYAGSGLCKPDVCGPDSKGNKFQPVHVSRCLDKSCTAYDATWVSAKPTTSSSKATSNVACTGQASKAGVNTVTVTATCSPTGASFSQPVTTSWAVTTSVAAPCAITVHETVVVTYYATCPAVNTVSQGITLPPAQNTSPPSQPANNNNASPPKGSKPNPVAPGSYPGGAELQGCYSHSHGFTLVESNSKMTATSCLAECAASGFKYSGVSGTDCYCGNDLDISLKPVDKSLCSVPCPGDKSKICGGPSIVDITIIIIVYECPPPPSTTTTASTSVASSMTSQTPDASSDPEPEPIMPRDFPTDTDVQLSPRAPEPASAPAAVSHMRVGGLLTGNKRSKPAIMVKRDFGLKQGMGYMS